MQITRLTAAPDKGSGGTRTLARFSLQITPDVRLHGLALQQRSDGTHRFVVPHVSGENVMSFTPQTAIRITEAAVAAYTGWPVANDRPNS